MAVFCSHCGKENMGESKFCKYCGQAISVLQPPTPEETPAEEAPVQPPAPQQPPGTLSPEPKTGRSKAKKAIILGLCIVAVVSLAIGGFFIYLKLTEPSRRLSEARSLQEEGDYQGSIALCDEIIEKWPDKEQAKEAESLRLDSFFLEAERLLEEGGEENYAEALSNFEYLMEVGYENEEGLEGGRIRLYLAWAMYLRNEYSFREAVDCYDKAGALQPLGPDDNYSKIECLFQLGEQLKEAGDYGEAVHAYERCLNEDSQGPLAEVSSTNYIDMTVAANTGVATPSKAPTSSGNVRVNVQNTGSFAKKWYISGPTSTIVDLQPGQSTDIYILPGYYNTYLISPGTTVTPFTRVGEDFTMTTGTGVWYTYTLFEE